MAVLIKTNDCKQWPCIEYLLIVPGRLEIVLSKDHTQSEQETCSELYNSRKARSLEIMQFGFRITISPHSFLSRENKSPRFIIMNLCWFISKPVSMSTKLDSFVWSFISSLKWYLTMKVDLYPATFLAHLKKQYKLELSL